MRYSIESLAARQQVIDTINQLFIQTDARNWLMVQKCFTDSVKVDLTSLDGTTDAKAMTPAEITDAWEKNLSDASEIHHQLGNYVVDLHGPNAASAECYCIAYHLLPENPEASPRTVVGSYEFELERGPDDLWRICRLWFTCKFIS